MEELRNLYPNAYDYVIDVGPYKYSRVHYPDRRYRVMTINATECINSCLKFARQSSMLTLVEFIRNMLQRWFHDRYRAAQVMHHQLTEETRLVILKFMEKYNFMTVNPVGWNIFSVKRFGKQWTVDLTRKTCTCNKFQLDHLPCSHSLVAARYIIHFSVRLILLKRESHCFYCFYRDRNMDFTFLSVDYYKRKTLTDMYSVPIMPVEHPSTWIMPSDIAERVVLNPISRRQACRPKVGRNISSSEMTTTQNCRRCGQPGQNSRRCSNPTLINEGPNRVVPEEYKHKCSICHTVGHNRQTYPTRDSTVE
ncbi:hypothetical protein Ddye_009042 [Dipteronia dyeriana]|uniref:SWIM-type domain-containing protein n=1 Tax=Dipteronia dyeriana TaxID=168575 RepID=A0AAE0CLW3_9ROSI|nr:hypothetical protein Ddye_009042 [Dipteronia dyeriana]